MVTCRFSLCVWACMDRAGRSALAWGDRLAGEILKEDGVPIALLSKYLGEIDGDLLLLEDSFISGMGRLACLCGQAARPAPEMPLGNSRALPVPVGDWTLLARFGIPRLRRCCWQAKVKEVEEAKGTL